MIKYSLICKKCDLTFESWFASSKEYEKLKKKNLLNCYSCNSLNVEKGLMAPSINKRTFDKSKKDLKKYKKIKKISFKLKLERLALTNNSSCRKINEN